ncbi:MAG: hypothetical protein IJS91_04820 [Bacteroidales bacterium]|nr:hypothetical protein [Deltaproteobacteria bacterium]MBQ7640297.1 hypothetical protein [Bacteroidales bacterium]
MNLATWIILSVVAAAFVAVAVTLIRRRKRCAPGCANCPFAEGCQRRK